MKQYFVEKYTWNGKLILTTRRWRSKQKNKTKKYIGVLNIWKSYMWTAEWRIKWRHGSSHFCSCEKKSLKKIRACTGFEPLNSRRYRCSALSQLGAGRCDVSTDMKFYLFMIKKELRCTSKAQFSVITLHQSTVLTIYCAFIYSCKSTGSPVSYGLFAEWCLQLVMKLECHPEALYDSRSPSIIWWAPDDSELTK